MGLFDLFKKKEPKVEITFTAHEPTPGEMEQQWKKQTQGRIKNLQKDEAGLYPHEILMLSYLEKYAGGKEPARFWEREYDVDDVSALIASLEKRGFAKNGVLTEAGESEISKNEYVLYMHRHKFFDISMLRMSILVNQHPDMKYRDLIWGEFNRLLMEYAKKQKWGLYRNTKFNMYQFLLEEKRYTDAFARLSEVFFYDLNGDVEPVIAPALIEGFQDLGRKLDYSDEELESILAKLFRDMYAPSRRYTNDNIIRMIVAYSFGNNEYAEKIFNKRQ